MAASFTRVFVYGTLKTGLPNHYLLKDRSVGTAKFVCHGYTQEKHPLVISTSARIPMLLEDPGNGEHVRGEIYEVDQPKLEILDELESVGILYDRKGLSIVTQEDNMNQVIRTAHTYIITKFQKHLLDLPFISNYSEEHAKLYLPKAERDYEEDIIAHVKGK